MYLHQNEFPQEFGNICRKNNSSKVLSSIRVSVNTGPHRIRATLNSPSTFCLHVLVLCQGVLGP